MKNVVVFTALFMLSICGISQKPAGFMKNSAGILLTELPLLDFRLNYERRFSASHAIKLDLGYKPSWDLVRDFHQFDVPDKMTGMRYGGCASWYYIAPGYKFYFGREKQAFLTVEVFYKLIYAGKIIFIDAPSSSYRIHDQRTLKTHVAGVNILAGKRMLISEGMKTNFGFDLFLGVGIRIKYQNTTIFGSAMSTSGWDSPPLEIAIPLSGAPAYFHEFYLQPAFLFGINFFVEWN